MAEPSAPFRYAAQMRFSDSDALGHVNHARVLAYLEDARIALLGAARQEGTDLSEQGVILAHLDIDYLGPVYVRPEPIEVEVWVERVGRSSIGLGYRAVQDGEAVVSANTVLVAYDYTRGASRPLSDAERASLERFRRRA